MRVDSLDTVRGFAILAMIVAHTWVFIRDGTSAATDSALTLVNDVASPLFALVIGVTAGLNLTRITRARRGRFVLSWILKALLLIVIGELLDLRFSGVAIVLDFLGIAMLAATPFLFLGSRWLLAAFGALVVLGPLLNLAAREWAHAHPLEATTGVGATLLDWTVLGSSYRLTGLLPMILLGLVLSRWQLGDNRRTALVLGAGIVLVVASLVAESFEQGMGGRVSGSWSDMLRDLGLSLTAYGGITLLLDATPDALRRVLRVVARPVTAMGTMALSVYCLHVIVLMVLWTRILAGEASWLSIGRQFDPAAGLWVMVVVIAGCALFATLWWRYLGTGPVERVLGVLSLAHDPDFLWRPRELRRPAGTSP
ncbi:MAG: acyltransferase family protein [Leifsonia sp.]